MSDIEAVRARIIEDGHRLYRRKRRKIIIRVVYLLVAGCLAGIGLAAILAGMNVVEWHGILAETVGLWTRYVQPLTAYPLHWSVLAFQGVGLNIHVPDWLPDYVAIGIVVVANFSRNVGGFWHGDEGFFSELNRMLVVFAFWPIVMAILVLLALQMLLFFAVVDPDELVSMLLMVAPVIFVGLMYAANRFLLG